MIESPHSRRKLKLVSPYVATVIGAAISSILIDILILPFVLPWRRPVQDWMIAHGFGAWAGKYGIFNLNIPTFILAFAGGLLIGALCGSRWRRFVIIYATAYIAVPNILWPQLFTVSLPSSGWPLVTRVLFYKFVSVFPLAILGGWLASRSGKRRRQQQRADGLCESCGYNLTGNTSGVCPECGRCVPVEHLRIAVQ